MDNPHVPACNKYIRITILFSLTPFKIDLQGAGVIWTTHMLAASKVKMNGSEKKVNRNTKTMFLVSKCNNYSSIKIMCN